MPWNWVIGEFMAGRSFSTPLPVGGVKLCSADLPLNPPNKPQIPVIDPCVAPGSLCQNCSHVSPRVFCPIQTFILCFQMLSLSLTQLWDTSPTSPLSLPHGTGHTQSCSWNFLVISQCPARGNVPLSKQWPQLHFGGAKDVPGCLRQHYGFL